MAKNDYIIVGDMAPHRMAKSEFEALAEDWRLEDRKDITQPPFCEWCLKCDCTDHVQKVDREHYSKNMLALSTKTFSGKQWVRGRERNIEQGKLFNWICKLCAHKKNLQMDFHEFGEEEPSIDQKPNGHPKETRKK